MRRNTGRNTVMRRIRKLALALTACLGFAVVAPMYFAERRLDDSFAIASVSAAPRDLHVLTLPVRLSSTPDLILMRGVVYDFGPMSGPTAGTVQPASTADPAGATPPALMSQVLLESPVFSLNAAGRRAMIAASRGEAEGAELEPVSEVAGDPQPMLPVLRQIASLGYDLITIRRGTLNITMLDGSVEALTDIQAEIKTTPQGKVTGQGGFTVRGQRVAFDAALPPPTDKTLPPLRRPLQLSFKSPLLQGSFDGYADLADDLQLSGKTEISALSLRSLARWFGLPLPYAESFGAATIKGELTWARRSLAFEKAHIEVDGNDGNGRLVLNLGDDRPLLEATLDFAALNLTPYIEATRTQLFGFELPVTWGSPFDISLPMIRHLDADMRISARRVALKDYTLGQGAATITAQSGKLHADIAELELPSGSLSAQVTAIMSEAVPRYALRAKIENLEAASATALFTKSAALSGVGTLSLDLTSTGRSLAEVTRRLSGKATLAMPEGGRMALDLAAMRPAAQTGGVRGLAQLAKAHTHLDRLEARALIIDGVAFTEDVQARAGDMALALVGRLGLVDGNIDARLMLKPNLPADQPLRLSDAAVKTLTLRGSWSKLDVLTEDNNLGGLLR